MIKRLKLSRETVRELTREQLEAAAAAQRPSQVTCGYTCVIGYSCEATQCPAP